MLIFTVVTGLSPYFYVYVISQFAIGVCYGGFRINCVILGMLHKSSFSVNDIMKILMHWYCCLYHHDFVFVVATEWTGVAQRSYGSCLSQVLASLGQVVFLALIYYYRNWRMCQFIMAGPIGFVVLYIWYVLENSSYWRNSSPQNGNVIINASHSCHPCFQTKISLVCACLLMGNISVIDVTFWVKTSESF